MGPSSKAKFKGQVRVKSEVESKAKANSTSLRARPVVSFFLVNKELKSLLKQPPLRTAIALSNFMADFFHPGVGFVLCGEAAADLGLQAGACGEDHLDGEFFFGG